MSSEIAGSTEIMTVERLDAELQPKAQELAQSIDLTDSQLVVQYGVGAQSEISKFADTILTEVRNKDSGYVGDVLTGLIGTIKAVDADGLSSEPGAIGKLFGGLKRRIQKFMARYETLSTQIDAIIQKLEDARMQLLKDVALMDKLYDKNVQYLGELDVHIAAGKLSLDRFRSTVLPRMQAKVEASSDAALAQQLQDLYQSANRFEKKLHDMQLSRMIAIQTGPQIRLIQNNSRTLVEKIQSSVLTTIPLWKNQIVIAISLFRQKSTLEIQRRVSDTTNELLQKNSAMLKQVSGGVARESERGIVEIETLRKVNGDLIGTIEETLSIQAEGRRTRAEAERELAKMEDELRERLKTIGAPEA